MACHPMFTQQCPLLQSQSGYCQYTRGLLIMFEFCMFAKRVVHVVTLDGSHNSCSFHWSCYTVHHCCQWFDKRVDVCYNVHHYCLQFEKELFRVVVVGYDIHYCFFMECFVLWLVMLSIITVCCFPFDFVKGEVHVLVVCYFVHHYFLMFARAVVRVLVIWYTVHYWCSTSDKRVDLFLTWLGVLSIITI